MQFSHLRRWALIIVISGTTNISQAQFIISNLAVPDSILFNNFDGSGFSANPTLGQLNSNTWSLIGLSDGDLNFSAEGTTGDYARGTSTGGITSGGVYSFFTGKSSVLGIQPIGSDMTPGEVILKVQNGVGSDINQIAVSYQLWSFNDQERSNSVLFSYSLDNVNFTTVPGLDYASDEVAMIIPAWDSVKFSTTISMLIPDNNLIYLKWTFDDFSGTGSRDEFGLDHIKITGDFVTSIKEESLDFTVLQDVFNGRLVAKSKNKIEL
ncbi:MAG: hypothetical protein IH948_10425 [Bacteroidetes bacterium]|nr:hypothetical protein [Bacteroidota bacterium]